MSSRWVTPPPYMNRAVIYLVCGSFLALIAWSCWGELDVVVTARGRMVSELQPQLIQSAVPGTVARIHVREGASVQRGEILIELDGELLGADLRAASEREAQLRAELARLAEEKARPGGGAAAGAAAVASPRISDQEELRSLRTSAYRQRRSELSAAVDASKSTLSAGESTLAGLKHRHSVAKDKEETARPYVGVAIPRFQYLQWKDEVLLLEKDIAAQEHLNQRYRQQVGELTSKLSGMSAEYRAALSSEVALKKSALEVQLAEVAKARKLADSLQVRAPVTGIVQKLSVTTLGASVHAGSHLATISPSGKVVAEVMIPNEEKAYLRAGQKVDIKFDSFPFQKYGRMGAVIDWVSPDAEASDTSKFSLLTRPAQARNLQDSFPQYVYRARVSPDPTSNTKINVEPGQTVQVDIYTDKRRIVDFFLFPAKEMLSNAMRVH